MKYWLAIDGESSGPHSVEEVGEMLRERRVTRETPAMPEEGEDWTPLSGIPELSALPAPPPPPSVRPMRSMRPRPTVAGALTGQAQPHTGPGTRPVAVAQPSSVVPITIIFVVIALLAGGGGIYVYNHSQELKKAEAEATAEAEANQRVAEAASREAAERAANPAIALEGASREQVIAALRKAEAVVTEKPFEVNMSMTPTDDTDIAMLKGLEDLQVLHLGGGKITDEGLSVLAGLTDLRELSIGVVVEPDVGEGAKVRHAAPSAGLLKVSDAGLEHLTKLKGLHKLYLWNCHISDAGLEILDQTRWLYDLELVDTSVSEAAVRKFTRDHPEIAVTVRSSGFESEP